MLNFKLQKIHNIVEQEIRVTDLVKSMNLNIRVLVFFNNLQRVKLLVYKQIQIIILLSKVDKK